MVIVVLMEIVSIMCKYLTEVNKCNKYTSIAIYCDSCAGQNKNKAMLVMIYHTLLNVCKSINEIKICLDIHLCQLTRFM